MVKKVSKGASSAKSSASGAAAAVNSAAALAESIKGSAQQIYLAGLAQFNKAQKDGTHVFEGLVKEGLAIQRKTQAVAEERIGEVTSRAASMANDVASKASGQWNKLEDMFEQRVSRALNKLGVPSAKDIDSLIKRIDALSAKVGSAKPVRAAAKTVKAKATATVKKAAPKRARKA
jgi:poly(hydroxyalkanoate) granule-associated protein